MVRLNQHSSKIRYLLLETKIEGYRLLAELYDVAEAPRWVYLFAGTAWQAHLEESPIVLEASQVSPEYQWALSGLKDGTLSGLILESSVPLESVAGWARERLTVRFDGERQGLLRFYDPLIWHRLTPPSNPKGGIIERAISWHDEAGSQRWQTIDYPEPVEMSPVPALSEEQWRKLNSSYT